MNENMTELFQLAQDAFEDALLMGCGEDSCANTLPPWWPGWKTHTKDKGICSLQAEAV